MISSYKMLMAAGATFLAVNAYSAVPTIKAFPTGVLIGNVSDNGKWGVSENGGETESGELFTSGGALWNLLTMTSTPINSGVSGRAGVSDVTDDGMTVVGSYNYKPAYWNALTEKWTLLPLPEGTVSGSLLAVTPDGRRAVGYANVQTEWDAVPVAYDLTNDAIIELTNVPTKDMDHAVSELGVFSAISADGRYILGKLSQHILQPISMCTYVYDTETDTYDFVGFTPNDRRPWTPDYKYSLFIDMPVMSPNGKYVTGASYIGKEIEGSNFLNEYHVAFKYDVEEKKSQTYDGTYDGDVAGCAVTDNGLLMVSVPAVNPYSDMAIRKGDYYYGLSEIFKQAYNVDLSTLTGTANSGRPMGVSSDGKVMTMITGPDAGYLLRMTDDWEDLISKVNLLSNYTVSPAAGSMFSSLSGLTINFNREVGLSGAASRISLADSEGKTIANALSAEAQERAVSIRFRPVTLEKDKQYKVVIPEGFVTMSGDANVFSGRIEINYTGRSNTAVSAISAEPADGATFSRLDAATNCIYVRFDAPVKIAEGAGAILSRKNDGVKLADLDISLYAPNTLIIYPLSRQYLYDGSEYTVVIPAGTVTDLSGVGANAAIELNYKGNYVREVSADDKYIFHDDCQNYDGFMFHDLDRLAPGSEPASWGFTENTAGWFLVRDSSTSTDMALAAHSMFASSGKSDDWAVTPQLYIPDTKCYLQFEAQSYRKSKADRLKVYAYVCENGYSTINDEIANDIRTNGQLIFDEQLSAGENDETMEGEWQEYTVSLSGYAEKNIYLAFVNENENQSAVFIHRVDVVHDMQFLSTVTSPTTVVDAASAPVAGKLSFISDLLTVNKIELTLNDSEGNAISSIARQGLDLGKGKYFDFAFDNPLPLKPKSSNRFTITIVVNDDTRTSIGGIIKNLAFEPIHRVVIEEYSGRDCSNCPRGFSAMENLERLYPGQIIPIVLRTYESDPLGNGMDGYTNFLGINLLGAPSAAVNRSYYCYPMTSVGNDYRFSGEGTDDFTWLDAVVKEMSVYADADLTFTSVYDGETGQITIEGNTRFALDSSRNVNLFTVVNENKCRTEQENGMYYFDDPDLGEWGKGGIYGEKYVELDIDHVGRGSFGSTFNGSAGLVPAVQQAGVDNPFNFSVSMPATVGNVMNTEMVIMMIDSDNDRIINANVAPISVVNAGIDEIDGSHADAGATEYFNLQGRRVSNPSKGQLLIRVKGGKASKITF